MKYVTANLFYPRRWIFYTRKPQFICKHKKKMSVKRTTAKKYSYFIGIDVSKNKLDYAVMRGADLLFHYTAGNDEDNILGFIGELKKLPSFSMSKALFCMENTGIYCNHLLRSLKELKGNVALENPLQIKSSIGLVREKHDKGDAILIARYAQKNHADIRLWEERRAPIVELLSLATLRRRIVAMSLAIKTPLKEQQSFISKELQSQHVSLCQRSFTALKADLKKVDNRIRQVVKSDKRLKRLMRIILSVPGIGPVTAVEILIITNEFNNISDPRKFACYAGIVPFKKESGTFVQKPRISTFANKKIKSLLHLCAINAIQHDPELKAYYERKTAKEKKPKLCAINAIRNKIVQRVFACVKQDRLFENRPLPGQIVLCDQENIVEVVG